MGGGWVGGMGVRVNLATHLFVWAVRWHRPEELLI